MPGTVQDVFHALLDFCFLAILNATLQIRGKAKEAKLLPKVMWLVRGKTRISTGPLPHHTWPGWTLGLSRLVLLVLLI